MSPELVLVDSVLSAEARRQLVVPEDTLERLIILQGHRGRVVEVAPLPERDDYGESEPQLTGHQRSVETAEDGLAEIQEKSVHAGETSQSAVAPESTDLELVGAIAAVDPVMEHLGSDRAQDDSNTYPTLPAPPPEDVHEDATDAVLRLITRTA